MNNKIRLRLINELDRYNIDKSILDNYEFDVIDKKIVYKKDNMIKNYIEFKDNIGYRLKRNKEGSFRLQSIDISDKNSRGIFLENQLGGAQKSLSFVDFKKYFYYVNNNKDFLRLLNQDDIPINI